MDSRSSRLLSGRPVPSRHSARFISRSALVMAIDALRLPMCLRTMTVPPRRSKAKAEGPCPDRHGPRLIRSGRKSYDDPTATRSLMTPVRRSDAEQVDHEDQGLTGLDRRRRALVAVGEVGGDGQLAPGADPHALHALVPALDDPAAAQREAERLTTVPAGVELLAGAEGHAHVVDGDGLAGLRNLAVALPDVLDLQVRRGLAAREVDLGLVDAHVTRSCWFTERQQGPVLHPRGRHLRACRPCVTPSPGCPR